MIQILNIPEERILTKIHIIRGQKVMLDMDLSELYRVETKQLKRQVRRNIARFPPDFMFELTAAEFENLRCQIGTSSLESTRYSPMAFTEQGVSMISSVLNNPTAIEVNIQIIRAFIKMREVLMTIPDLLLKIEKLEKQSDVHDKSIAIIFSYLKELISEDKQPKKALGYRPSVDVPTT